MREPVPAATRVSLARLWSAHAPELRSPRQMVGRQWEGCAATIGAMPRCDFDCTSCYLPRSANRSKPAPLEALFEQLELIAASFGPWGNVQLTDGEITLRRPDELVALVRRAVELQLIPMVMTHGESFLRDPVLLERLVVEGGLREVSFHVDTTQRGGRTRARSVAHERELHPVRDACAELLRAIQRRTGVQLRAASTVTVEAHNAEQVGEIVRWTLSNSDVLRVLSFQPVAQVGRTRADGGGGVEALWRSIDAVLGADSADSNLWFGHPDCSRVVMGMVWREPGAAARFLPWRDVSDARSERFVADWLARWGGISMRSDSAGVALARASGVLLRSPLLVARGALETARWLRLRAARPAWRAGLELLRGRAQLRPLAIVTHHFMDAHELDTPRGAERCAACVFKAPIDGRMVSMCEINARGLREQLYARSTGVQTAGASAVAQLDSQDFARNS